MGMANYEVVNLWLDDIRPAPEGWLWVKTVRSAIQAMENKIVDKMSLDHDLGACEDCMDGYEGPDDWLEKHLAQSMPNCPHYGTGYNFVEWMEEHDIWPQQKPTVHSANPAGRAKMLAAIERHYGA